MTKREFLNMVIADTTNEEIKAFAIEEIEKMDKKNASRSSKMSKTQLENVEIKKSILAFLEGKVDVRAKDVAEGLQLKSTSKASSLLKQLVDNGEVVRYETKLEKIGKTNVYKLAE